MKYLFNLKSNLNINEIELYLRKFSNLSIRDNSIIFLNYISCFLSNKFNGLNYGIQSFDNISKPTSGCVSIQQIKSFHNIKYVLINHSDQTSFFNHINLTYINNQIKIANDVNLIPIICFGEKKKINNLKTRLKLLLKQINKFDIVNISEIHLAYEPIYMVGTNYEINISDVEFIIINIKNYLIKKFPTKSISIYYGGNVNSSNFHDFHETKIDGLLIGRFGLDLDNIAKLN